MVNYRIIFKIDSIINFDESFSVEDVVFYYENKVLYAQVTINANDPMKAQSIALRKVMKTVSILGYMFKNSVNFHIERVEELDAQGKVVSSMSSIEASLYVRKQISQTEVSEMSRLLKLMEVESDLVNVMLYANQPDFKTWRVLSNVYEIIDHNANIKQQAWIVKKNRNLFNQTANHPAASGLGARHGYQKNDPPENPMELEDAISLINNLIEKWIEYLLSKHNL